MIEGDPRREGIFLKEWAMKQASKVEAPKNQGWAGPRKRDPFRIRTGNECCRPLQEPATFTGTVLMCAWSSPYSLVEMATSRSETITVLRSVL